MYVNQINDGFKVTLSSRERDYTDGYERIDYDIDP